MAAESDPPVFEWYVKNYGNEVNLFIDHSQILQLEGLRQNIWGNKSLLSQYLAIIASDLEEDRS